LKKEIQINPYIGCFQINSSMANSKNSVSTFRNDAIANFDATEIAIKIKDKSISQQEVLDSVKRRLADANPAINAILCSDFEIGLKHKRHPKEAVFSGVPTFIKDLLNVKGFPTSHGSKAMPNLPVKSNDKAVNQIESTGCIVVGKSTTSEIGLLPATETLVSGNTCNPHNTGYSTGGSSGGSAALVAAGVVPFAHAADGGGSIRIPAACCGLVGLKPTRGRHNQSPTKNLPIDIVTQGIVSKSVRDTANYFAAIEQYYKPKHLPFIGKVEHAGKKRLKIGVFTDSPAGVESHPEVVNATLEAAKKCETLGHQVEFIKNPYGPEVLFDFLIYYSFLANMASTFGKLTYDIKFDANKLEPFTKELAGYFSKLAILFPASVKRLNKTLPKTYQKQFHQFDILLSPVLASPVPQLGYFGTDVPFLAHIMRMNSYVNFTIIQNATGAPAISLPMGKCSKGLPIGAMFAANTGQEAILLELAFELEEAKMFQPFL
jgi:amidase